MVLGLSFNVKVMAETPSVNDTLCTNTNLANEAPFFIQPLIKKFRHTKNVYLSTFFQPYHMIHDLVLKPNEPILFNGKFDYDWILHKDLVDEYIHVYLFADHSDEWRYLGKYKTDSNGEIFVSLSNMPAGDYLVRMVVEGDGSTVDGFTSIVNPGHEAIVFDIDGTLTISDFEMIKDYLSLSRAAPYYYAQQVLEAYKEKGYELIFLTARPYWMASVSRDWLTTILQQNSWPLKTRNTVFNPTGTARYKADYLTQLINEKKLNIVRVYGNASTDIEAYELAGIPKKETFIIGPNAGNNGTNPIKDHYFNHYYDVVLPTPAAQCKR